ncbi:MAG: hypothetical protein SWY16_01595 [Cyanobacteriota bacterium]|nr:hypothetical protein [Cyanobacteriota bacterium]
MFVSNHISKIVIPTTIIAIFAALSPWLTGDKGNLTDLKQGSPHQNVISSVRARASTRKIDRTLLHEFNSDGQWQRTSNWAVEGMVEHFYATDVFGSSSDARKNGRFDRKRSTSELTGNGRSWRQWVGFERRDARDVFPQNLFDGDDNITQEDWYELFATPNSAGPVAIGAAEGTRTATGGTTERYWGHRDPGNGARNLGTFSYQHSASSPQQADMLQLARLKRQITQVKRQARDRQIDLSTLDLVVAADLLNQSPEAGLHFMENLKQARENGLEGLDALLNARMYSYVNPKTQSLEAAGFDNSWANLKHDQMRRLEEIKAALKEQGVL